MSGNLVCDWMVPDPITISPTSPLRDAYWLMLENKIRRLPVMDGDRLVGIVTLEDLRPIASHHLSLCPQCKAKFEKWLVKQRGG